MRNDIIIVTWGGFGDLLVCTPTLKAIRETYKDRKIIVYCTGKGHKDVLLNNPYIDSVRLLKIPSMWRYPHHLFLYLFRRSKIKYYQLAFQHIPLTWVYRKSVKEVVPEIFADIGIKLADTKIQLFFTKKEEEKARKALAPFRNVILMHIHSNSSVNHHWPMEKWNALVRELPEYTFIQVGHTDEPAVAGAVDWRGKTTIRDVFCLLKFSMSFVGVDSSLSHATNAFDLPGVVLFGDSSPVYWGHDNNINIYKKVRCSPCYYYVWNCPCPYGHECMNLITVDEVRKAILMQVGTAASAGELLTA